MKQVMSVVVSIVLISLCSCTNSNERTSRSELNDAGKSVIIRTEEQLTPLLESLKAGKAKKNVTLIGKLDLGSNPKLDPSKLIIGKTAVNFGHYLDKAKYNGQNVLIKADIVHNAEGAQVSGYMIVNVQHIEIVEQP